MHWSTAMATSCCREVQHSTGHRLAASAAVGSSATAVLFPKLQAGGLGLLSPVPSCWVPAHRMVSEESCAHTNSRTDAPASRFHPPWCPAVERAAAPCACTPALGGVLVPTVLHSSKQAVGAETARKLAQ